MDSYLPALALLAVTAVGVAGVYGISALARPGEEALACEPFLSGVAVTEHAVSRYHARWYALTPVFLAFDMEMIFMYPWVLVVGTMGAKAVVEMFAFLAVLVAGVLYAWREGAFRWA